MTTTEPASETVVMVPVEEHAVRQYMTLLRDRKDLVDRQAVADALALLEREEDPLARLALREKVEELTHVDEDAITEAFIKHARQWALDNDIDVRAFLAEGVDPKVLKKAGFTVPGKRGKRHTSGPRAPKGVARSLILNASPERPFTYEEMARATGLAMSTVRLHIGRLVEEGVLTKLEQGAASSKGGRPATLFQKVA